MDESWSELFTKRGPSFLYRLPNLADTSPKELSASDDLEKVTLRFESEAGRTASSVKMRALVKMQKEVCRTRAVKLHWDLTKKGNWPSEIRNAWIYRWGGESCETRITIDD